MPMIRALGVLFVCAILGAAPGTVAAQDVLTLTNGDRLTGHLKAVEGGTWIFVHAGGDLKVPADQVATFVTVEPIGVRLADGTIAAGRMIVQQGVMGLQSAGGGFRAVSPPDLAAVGDADDLAALRPVTIGLFTPFQRFWSVALGAGFASKSGNSESRGVNADAVIERRSPKDRLAFGLGTAAQWAPDASGTLQKNVEKYYGSARVDVFFSSALYVFGSTLQEADRFQGIDLRSTYGGGLGYQVVATTATDLRFDASGGYRYENFTPAVGDSASGTPTVGAGGALSQQLGPVTFAWSVDWNSGLDEFANYRLLSSSSLSTALVQGLGFRLASRNEYNNRPPSGIEKHDWLLTASLTYKLGG